MGDPGAGAVGEKRGPCLPNRLSHPSPQDRERSLASLPLQPNNHTGTRLRTPCHTIVTRGPQPGRQSKKLTEKETGFLPCGQHSHSLSRPAISKPKASPSSQAPPLATGVSIPRTPTPKPRPESLPELIKPLINSIFPPHCMLLISFL